ncbi:hypothetical protein [Aquisalinus flavus]|uniref:Lipoprotein n=1 Tax=Aquisalinus flavus TaxID=1526572 RepID=A0A8J2V2V5_9PROT|nr:hypothetical protein [Aquisalinus flavus]MBD0426444.1 hypothetical protein [Aquisalinus flavus]UNE48002.1 hypothetical protein FF099_08045 [Aquisalinus flavus]GGD07864.1 hypothetical protein GCM10011342_15920 [Aquisalinus flavus]
MNKILLATLSLSALLAACAEDAATPAAPEETASEELTAEETDEVIEDLEADMASLPVRAGDEDLAGADCDPATAEGYCGVLFGMSAGEARAAYPGGLVGGPDEDPYGDPGCYYLNVAPENYEIGFMVVDGTVMRLDVRAPGVTTEAGAMVGMAAEDVLARYPDAERLPNKYTDEDDIHVDLGNDAKAIFEQEVGEGTISRYRIGLAPPVDYVEGCA